jgi:hypothetical protein
MPNHLVGAGEPSAVAAPRLPETRLERAHLAPRASLHPGRSSGFPKRRPRNLTPFHNLTRFPSVKLARGTTTKLMAIAAFAAAVVPIVFALFEEARWGSCRALPGGDLAMLEIHLRQAVHGTHLLGAYSQYGWYHPGPLYYYVLAPFYALGRGTSRSLNVAVALLNLAAVLAMLALHVKLEKGAKGRLLGALVIAGFCSALATRVPEGAFPTNPLIELWNPVVTILPFGLLCFTSAAIALGRIALLPLAVFLHAFVIQTHVSYAPPATLLLGFGLAWTAVQRTTAPERMLRAAGIAALFAFVLWLPPLVALLAGQRGNAVAVLRFAISDRRQHVHLLDAIPYGLRQLHAPLLYWLGFDVGSGTALAVTLTLVELAACATCLMPTARRARPYPAVIAAATSLLTLVAVVQSLAVVSLREQVYYYQTLWFFVVGCLGWYTVPYGVEALLGGRATAVRSLAWALPAAAWAVSCFALSAVKRDFARCIARTPERPEATETALPVLAALFDQARHPHPNYVLDTSDAGPDLPNVMLELEKHGIEPLVSADWIYRLGNGARYGYEDQPGLHVSSRLSHEHPLWRGLGNADIYADDLDQVVARLKPILSTSPAPPKPAVEERRSARRQRRRGPQRKRPPEAVADAPESQLTVGFAEIDPEAGFMTGVRMKSPARAEYVVEGSDDNVHFERLGVSEVIHTSGIVWRPFFFNDGRTWRFIRIRGVDAAPEVTDVTAIVSRGQVLDPRTAPSSNGDLELSLARGQAYDLTMRLRTPPEPSAPRTLRLSCSGETLGEVKVASGVIQNHTFVVPARCTGPKTELHLALVSAPDGEGNLRREVEVCGVWVQPTELTP